MSGVCFFMPTFNKSGVTSVVTITIRTMAGNIFSLTSPDCAPFCATIRATSPRETMPRPIDIESYEPKPVSLAPIFVVFMKYYKS